ncbi:hypothetical protein SDC9_143067 [bioreactor metagenome]|uniref:Uncharacterized protein n=1 Tax=bioreactor metagenome TaxID=1076179 RepID=A0A645E2Y0_9ZZZZ
MLFLLVEFLRQLSVREYGFQEKLKLCHQDKNLKPSFQMLPLRENQLGWEHRQNLLKFHQPYEKDNQYQA